MSVILGYIMKMLFFILPSAPFYILLRFLFLSRKEARINFYREGAMLLFSLFVVGLLSQTVLPEFQITEGSVVLLHHREHTTNLVFFRVIPETVYEVFIKGNFHYFLIHFLGNIIMFLPFGFMIPLLWNLRWKKVILCGFFFSFFVETAQLFLRRGTDVDDLILNTIGVSIGYLLFRVIHKKWNRFVERFR